GRPRRLRCSRSRPARRGDRPHAHIVARRGRRDPLRASFPTPSGPSGPRARTAQCAHRRADRPAAGGGAVPQRCDVGLWEPLSWRLLFCEAFASGLVTTRVSRAATEPPLQFSTVTGTSPQWELTIDLGTNLLWRRSCKSSYRPRTSRSISIS